jgi:hypothetical protein
MKADPASHQPDQTSPASQSINQSINQSNQSIIIQLLIISFRQVSLWLANTIFHHRRKLEASHTVPPVALHRKLNRTTKLTGTAVSLMAAADLLSLPASGPNADGKSNPRSGRVSKYPTYYSAASSARILSWYCYSRVIRRIGS